MSSQFYPHIIINPPKRQTGFMLDGNSVPRREEEPEAFRAGLGEQQK